MPDLHFDLHGIVSLSLESAPPRVADLFSNELYRFQMGEIGRPDVLVARESEEEAGEVIAAVEKGRLLKRVDGREDFSIFGIAWRFEGLEGTVHVRFRESADPLMVWHVAEQLVKVKFMQNGFAFMHASAFDFGGRCCAVIGWSQMGKTTFLMEALRRGCGYLADDFTVVGKDASVLAYAPRRVALGDRGPAGGESGGRPSGRWAGWESAAVRVGRRLPGRWMLKQVLPGFSARRAPAAPEYVSLDTVSLFPEAPLPRRSSLSSVLVLSAKPGGRTTVTPLAPEDALERAVACTVHDFEQMLRFFALYSYLKRPDASARHWIGGVVERVTDILKPSFQSLSSCLEVRMSPPLEASEVGSVIDQVVASGAFGEVRG